MSILLVGGMDRLERHYRDEANRVGIQLKVYTKPRKGMKSRIKSCDAVIIFTNKVSHSARKEVIYVARSNNISVFLSRSCGVCAIRDCLNCIKTNRGGFR